MEREIKTIYSRAAGKARKSFPVTDLPSNLSAGEGGDIQNLLREVQVYERGDGLGATFLTCRRRGGLASVGPERWQGEDNYPQDQGEIGKNWLWSTKKKGDGKGRGERWKFAIARRRRRGAAHISGGRESPISTRVPQARKTNEKGTRGGSSLSTINKAMGGAGLKGEVRHTPSFRRIAP